MNPDLINFIYLLSAILFILGIKGLTKPKIFSHLMMMIKKMRFNLTQNISHYLFAGQECTEMK